MYSSVLKNNPLRLFDVTLRDGLQSISKIYNVTEKLQMIENIIIKKNQMLLKSVRLSRQN